MDILNDKLSSSRTQVFALSNGCTITAAFEAYVIATLWNNLPDTKHTKLAVQPRAEGPLFVTLTDDREGDEKFMSNAISVTNVNPNDQQRVLIPQPTYKSQYLHTYTDVADIIQHVPKNREKLPFTLIFCENTYYKPSITYWTFFIMALARCKFLPVLGYVFGRLDEGECYTSNQLVQQFNNTTIMLSHSYPLPTIQQHYDDD